MDKSKRLTIRVSEALFDAILTDAESRAITYAAVTRGILNQHYFNPSRDIKPDNTNPKIRHHEL